MSLLPGQILPPNIPIGSVNEDNSVTINENWYLLLWNICQQVLANGQGANITELIALATDPSTRGPDQARQIGDLRTAIALIPNTAGRIAALEQQVADLQKIIYLSNTRAA